MNITIKKITEIEEAKDVWMKLNYQLDMDDDWLLRELYWELFKFPIIFYVAYVNDEPVGLLALQNNTNKGHFEFFGGSWFENNRIYVKKGNEEIRRKLFDAIEEPVKLEWMEHEIEGIEPEMLDEKFRLPLKDLTSIDDYINKFWSGKSRQNLKAQMRKIALNDIQIIEDNYEDYDLMVELNKKRFGEDSRFQNFERAEFIRKVIKNFNMKMITIIVNGRKESIGLSLLYKNGYIGLNSGTNNEINGLGKFLILQRIQQAINSGADFYDARSASLGWKEQFGFIGKPQYKYTKNILEK